QVVAHSKRRGLDLGRSGAALPVIDVVEYDFKAPLADHALDGFGIIAVVQQVLNAFREIVFGAPVQNVDGMARLQQLRDELTADEQCPSDDQNFHEATA